MNEPAEDPIEVLKKFVPLLETQAAQLRIQSRQNAMIASCASNQADLVEVAAKKYRKALEAGVHTDADADSLLAVLQTMNERIEGMFAALAKLELEKQSA